MPPPTRPPRPNRPTQRPFVKPPRPLYHDEDDYDHHTTVIYRPRPTNYPPYRPPPTKPPRPTHPYRPSSLGGSHHDHHPQVFQQDPPNKVDFYPVYPEDNEVEPTPLNTASNITFPTNHDRDCFGKYLLVNSHHTSRVNWISNEFKNGPFVH